MATVNASAVHEFFARVGGASVQLPSRWYGRPRDNQHRLTSVDEDADALEVVLDERHVLTFRGGVVVDDEGECLVFSGFAEAVWRSVGWGREGRVDEETFQSGEVRLWAPATGGAGRR